MIILLALLMASRPISIKTDAPGMFRIELFADTIINENTQVILDTIPKPVIDSAGNIVKYEYEVLQTIITADTLIVPMLRIWLGDDSWIFQPVGKEKRETIEGGD